LLKLANPTMIRLLKIWLYLNLIGCMILGQLAFAGPHQDAMKLLRQDKSEEAFELVQNYLKEHPLDPQMRFWMANLLEKKAATDQAFDIYLQLTQDYPELAEPHNNLGILWVQKGELLNAKASFEMALKDAPNLVNAQENLASVFLLLSRASLLKAQSMDPQSRAIPAKLKSISSVIDQFSTLSSAGIH